MEGYPPWWQVTQGGGDKKNKDQEDGGPKPTIGENISAADNRKNTKPCKVFAINYNKNTTIKRSRWNKLKYTSHVGNTKLSKKYDIWH